MADIADIPERPDWSGNRTMKPLLGMAIQEAVVLALIDSVHIPEDKSEPDVIKHMHKQDDLRRQWASDIYSMPDELLSTIDPIALAQNVARRLLGTGGWVVGDVYSGNASPREVVEATFTRPDKDPLGDIKFAMLDIGLRLVDDEDGES